MKKSKQQIPLNTYSKIIQPIMTQLDLLNKQLQEHFTWQKQLQKKEVPPITIIFWIIVLVLFFIAIGYLIITNMQLGIKTLLDLIWIPLILVLLLFIAETVSKGLNTANLMNFFMLLITYLTLVVAISTLVMTAESLKTSVNALTIASDESNRIAKISFIPPWPVSTDINESTVFWIENTGYRTILLEPHCTLQIKCDNNYSSNLAGAYVTYVATGRTVEDFSTTGSLILKIGDMMAFASSQEYGNLFVIDSNSIKGKTGCHVSCTIKTMSGEPLGDANIPIILR